MRRTNGWVNVALLALLVITTTSGGLAFAVGSTGAAGVITAVHGAAGLGLLLLVPAKWRIARRGFRRPGRSRKVTSAVLTALVLSAVASGLLHAIGGLRTYSAGPLPPLLPMQVHVGSALAALALLGAHAWRHRHHPLGLPGRPSPIKGQRSSVDRPQRPSARDRRVRDVPRRVVLRGVGLAGGSVALWLVAPGRDRRVTGSHEVGSGDPAAMPVTQWLLDPVPRIAVADWRLRTPGGELDLAALAALPQRSERAVLDCTGGWWAEQQWRGVPLAALGLGVGTAVDVVSATGYRRRLPAADAQQLLLATHAGGRPLSSGHGGPARLVAPGRRGFWWVKWVVAIEAVDEPWWWQPPFPVQ